MNRSSVDREAAWFDLERRVALLEQGLYGHVAPVADDALLTRCYLEAHRFVREIDPDSAGAWVFNAYSWDVRTLVRLGRLVRDPYPYRPFLALLDRCALAGVPGAEAARASLERVAQELLSAQGLELVRPRDTMHTLRLGEALARLKAV